MVEVDLAVGAALQAPQRRVHSGGRELRPRAWSRATYAARLSGLQDRVPNALRDLTKIVACTHDLVEAGIDASFHVIRGTNPDPADLMAEAAKDAGADLVVVGTRGHGRVAGMLLGSVTQSLLQVAPCPVVAVPPHVTAAAPAAV